MAAFWNCLQMAGVGVGVFLAASAFWIVAFGLADRIDAKREARRHG